MKFAYTFLCFAYNMNTVYAHAAYILHKSSQNILFEGSDPKRVD